MSGTGSVGAPSRTAAGLTDADIEDILDQVGHPRVARPRTVERIPGGLTNVNVKVTTPAGPAVARISTADSWLLAIDRDAEHANALAAARSGAAPAVLAYAPAAGVLVVDWVPGRTYSEDDVRDPARLPGIAAACRRLHAGAPFVGGFDMFAIQRGYLAVVQERGLRLPPRYLEFMPIVERIRRALAVRAEPAVPCHNDLLAANMIDDGERVWLIDFEYAGNGDPCFELGNIASESSLPVEMLPELVGHYYGARMRHKVARARLLGLMSKYGWTLWAVIQDAASTLDVDFWSWGMDKYDRAVAEFDDPGLEALIEEATRPD